MRDGERFHSRCCNFDGKGRYQVQDKKFEANQLDIAEKRIALRREMLKDTPDWNKVEQLNKEIGAIRAENRTIMMKEKGVLQFICNIPFILIIPKYLSLHFLYLLRILLFYF